jgi:hypothetical protein
MSGLENWEGNSMVGGEGEEGTWLDRKIRQLEEDSEIEYEPEDNDRS